MLSSPNRHPARPDSATLGPVMILQLCFIINPVGPSYFIYSPHIAKIYYDVFVFLKILFLFYISHCLKSFKMLLFNGT
jgi:hypothetical protein